jgi:hypothetical protein
MAYRASVSRIRPNALTIMRINGVFRYPLLDGVGGDAYRSVDSQHRQRVVLQQAMDRSDRDGQLLGGFGNRPE